MKTFCILLAAVACMTGSLAAQQRVLNLHELWERNGIEVYNRELTPIDDRSGIRLDKKEGEGVAWLKDVEFSEGIIEFDVRGENLKQHSFVGIAFHAKDDLTYDAIYLRPFQFQSEDEILRQRSIQYVSFPDFTWRKLREQFPGKYESAIVPSPDPNSWVKVKIVVKDGTVSTYINGNAQPSLVVQKVTNAVSGKIGFYVADTSGGDFANISIVKH
ncbi:hypothetical protein [Flavobacterium sp.]|uniref:hypothetical protein n=1 Tax=Flavobacterium sp. TaxID=239 RepID=UPI0039E308DF